MPRTRLKLATFVCVVVALASGAAPVAPSYSEVEATIARFRDTWQSRPASGVNTAAWTTYFQAVETQLGRYAGARTEDERLRALDRLYQMSAALAAVPGSPSNELRAALDRWLRPRVTLAWAVRRLEDTVRALPQAGSDTARQNREHWIGFVGEDLGAALRRYEGAQSTAERLDALDALRKALDTLNRTTSTARWVPASTLQGALAGVFDRPNVEAAADVWTLSRYLRQNVVNSGPVYRNGQVSQVTAGPHTGFGLLASDGGIAFYNRQAMSATTPIRGFQEQVASDRRGRRAAKLYYFTATSYNQGETVVTAILRPTGLDLDTRTLNNISATVCALPQPGKGLTRFIAAVIGQNRQRILQQVYQGAIGQIRAGVQRGSAEEAAERTVQNEVQQNSRLAAFLVGNDSAAFGNIALTGLDLHSRPQYALARATLRWRTDPRPYAGADLPKPAQLANIDSGVTADVHLASVLSNLARGAFETPRVQGTENIMIVTRNVPPGTPPGEAVTTTPNADFATYSNAVEEVRQQGNEGATALRVKRPSSPPRFAADRDGNLVVVVNDFTLDLSVPPNAPGGLGGEAPPRIYRIESPQAEFALSVKLLPTAGGPPQLDARIASFDPGPNARLLAIGEDEAAAREVGAFNRAIILGVVRNRIQGRPLSMSLAQASLPGYAFRSATDLDPSGWMRVVLQPTR